MYTHTGILEQTVVLVFLCVCGVGRGWGEWWGQSVGGEDRLHNARRTLHGDVEE